MARRDALTAGLRLAFFALIVRPVLTIILGANVRHRERLPAKGPAIIVANHNSHLDTLTIMAMYPLRRLDSLRPVAAMDYFLKNRLRAWFAANIIGIIPIARGARQAGRNPLEGCFAALDEGDILILFPEGSRGQPEILSQFKKGIAHLAKARPDIAIYPLFIHGLGKALPKDSMLLVPFNCDVIVGEPLRWNGSTDAFMDLLQARMMELAGQLKLQPWD